MSNRGCDVAVVPPTDDKVVVVGGRVVTGGCFRGDVGGRGSIGEWFGGGDRLTRSGCHPEGVGRWIGWLVAGPGIAKSRPGKSGQGQGGKISLQTFAK